jgi:hypothetical protein
MGEKSNACEVLWKNLTKRPLGRHRHIWEYNIAVDL